MRFHWYWPFAREEELAWAAATARSGEEIVVETIDRSAAPRAGTYGPVTVVRDLPDVERGPLGQMQWIASRANTYLGRTRRRRQHWAREQFDLVHLHYLNRFTDAAVPLPHPLVLSVHDVHPHVPRLGGASERLILRRICRRADAIVVHHQRLADQVIDALGVDARRVHVVPHQVFPTEAADSNPPDAPPNVLFFGALRSNKGIAVLDEAIELLARTELTVTIAGRGDSDIEQRALEMSARDPRISVDIGFASLERKRELFRHSSLVVLPYTSFASQSGVLHDAYGHGRPVVVTDVGALGKSVSEDGTGLVVPPADSRALAQAIQASLVDETWDRHAAAARRVREERSPVETGLRLRAVYDHVLP